ncbi:MAG: glutathione metabolism protein [Alphaproteobacteria bacterium]|nr:glutathione metabolism protein [Alphaproteobacteria bacterium]
MSLEIVPLYSVPFAALYFVLSVRAIGARRAGRKAIGPIGEAALDRRLRVHGNFAEYVPFVLLLLAFAELRGAPAAGLHVACVILLAARLAHAWGVSQTAENFRFRVAGMGGTFTALWSALAMIVATYL